MPDDVDPKHAVTRLGRDMLRSAAVDVVGKALSYAGLGLLAALALLVWQGGAVSVPAWLIALLLLLVVVGVLVVHRRQTDLKAASTSNARRIAELEPLERELGDLRRRHGELETTSKSKMERIAELEPLEEELNDVRGWSDILEGAVARFEVYTRHVAEVLDHLQRVVAGDIEVSISTYIERGILGPARDILVDLPADHVRLSVLLPDDDDKCFEMYFAAGHSISGQSKYRVPIQDTLSRIAYESGDPQAWDDVTTDDRFVQNPQASWPTKTMVSLPLWYGDEVIGVFNTISSQPSAFDPAEHRYLTSLASVISVAVGVNLKHNDDE